ncbi:MAG: hypothetical protein H6875_08415 [Hyphomicrobiaceae bacterium]|nr:hypothetical protein [Hyphomicrobiaceae bacterium]
MTRRVWQIAILAGLVATPAATAFAQTNPWYIPPRQTQVYQQPQAYQQQHQAYQQPLAYQQVQQFGLGAGYHVQQQQPAQVQQTGVQQWQQNPPAPATTGAVSNYPPPSASYVQPPQQIPQVQQPQTTYVLPPQTTYIAPPQQVYVQPQAPQQQVGVQPQYVQPYQAQPGAPAYQPQQPAGQPYQPQVIGSYPPLGVDVTQLSSNPKPQPVAQTAASIPAPAQVIVPSAAATVQVPYYAGQYGPTTLSPGLGGIGGFGGIGGMPSPSVFAPIGASPYLGLPFY